MKCPQTVMNPMKSGIMFCAEISEGVLNLGPMAKTKGTHGKRETAPLINVCGPPGVSVSLQDQDSQASSDQFGGSGQSPDARPDDDRIPFMGFHKPLPCHFGWESKCLGEIVRSS